MIIMSIRLIKINRQCNTCNINESRQWYYDKWGRTGWVCSNCYVSITNREKRPIYSTRNCNICSITKTMRWHRDKWGMVGWVCHSCYNSIVDREKRKFGKTIITRNRPKGLIYNVKHKKKWCGYGGHFTVPDPVTYRCKEHGFKVRKYARATNCTGRQRRRDTVARY